MLVAWWYAKRESTPALDRAMACVHEPHARPVLWHRGEGS